MQDHHENLDERCGCSRRDLLKAGTGAALTGLGLTQLSQLNRVQAAAGMAAPPNDFRALVCVFLRGGNDSANTIVPLSSDTYATYAQSRQNLAVPQNELLPITPVTSLGTDYGLHPAIPELRDLFQNRRLSVVSNVGSMLEPVTKAGWDNQVTPVPPHLFSHSDQQFQWEAGRGNPDNNIGWGGLVADRLLDLNAGSTLPLNLSLSGSNTLQLGESTLPYSLGPDGSISLDGFWGQQGILRKVAFDTLLSKPNAHRFADVYSAVQIKAQYLDKLLSEALDAAPTLTVPFNPDEPLDRQLQLVSRICSVQASLGVQRLVFLCELDGFDHHQGQLEEHPLLLGELSRALSHFDSAMHELGLEDRVTLFTCSDFGRTLTSNGKGSDHGWGGHQLVLGGGVRGGEIFGQMPNLEIDGPDDAGWGRTIPTASIEQYAATLSRWFGLTETQLGEVFPNLGNFASSDMGFMQAPPTS